MGVDKPLKLLVIQESDWLEKGPHDQHHLMEKLCLRGYTVRVIDFEVQWKLKAARFYSGRQVYRGVNKIYKGADLEIIRPGIIQSRLPGMDYISLLVTHRAEVARQLKEFRPDAIIGLGILNNYLGLILARRYNIPFMHYWLDLYHTLIPNKYFRPLGVVVEKRLLRGADCIVTTNEAMKNRLVAMGAKPEDTFSIGHGVDLDKFNPDEVDGTAVRHKLGIDRGDKVITFVGRLSRITGVREVATEIAKIKDDKVKFLVIGTGTREDELRRMQTELAMGSKIIVTGRRPFSEIPGLIAASDVCILPFYNIEMTRDIVPLKVYDYMCMGKPIVSTNLGGVLAEFGRDNGIYYVEDPQQVAHKALEVINGGDLARLAPVIRSRVTDKSWDALTDTLEKMLLDMIREKSQPSATEE